MNFLGVFEKRYWSYSDQQKWRESVRKEIMLARSNYYILIFGYVLG